ncbi:MAG: hypothetical protein ACOYO9_12270, partial [Candidatus Nanopelagicales bacterium]
MTAEATRSIPPIPSITFPADADRMHRFDPDMTAMILEYVEERLAIVETPVDGLGDRAVLEKAVAGLIGDDPRDAREVLDIYVEHMADTILSADSP